VATRGRFLTLATGLSDVETDTEETVPQYRAAQDFDLAGYLARTSDSARERVRRQLEAKTAQIEDRTTLYNESVARLRSEITAVDRDLDRLERMWADTTEDERVERERLARLYRELRETRQRFHREVRELDDERTELAAMLDEFDEGTALVEMAENWLQG
jgi:chromosome segregation ATPase